MFTLIPRPPSWDDRNCSYGHHPENYANKEFLLIEIKSDILPFKPKPKRFI